MDALYEDNQRLRGERDLLRRRLAEVEENFRRTVEGSQQEILAINEALATANSQLQELDRMKDAFLSMVTHELRTPLTVISGITEMLETGIYGELAPTQIEPLAQITFQAGRLRQLVDDLLDLSKMEAGMMKLHRETLDPRALVEAALRAVLTMAAQAEVAVVDEVGSDLPPIDGDGRRIEQALTNLLTNAIKFTPSGGRVTITAAAAAQGVRFCIADTGQGIPAAALPHLFDKFFQVNS